MTCKAIHICGHKVYSYAGTTFEIHSYCGPWPLRKDGAPRARATSAFWRLWEEFQKLPVEAQAKYRIQ